jgi:DNA-binding response OmpR family regulator
MGMLYDYDLIWLDLNLPDMHGYDVLKKLRASKVQTPVLVISGIGEMDSKIRSFGFGADDYVTKPFGLRELIARIRAVSRRRAVADLPVPEVLEIGNLKMDLSTRRAYMSGGEIELTTKEFDLLAYLAQHPGIVHRRTDIMETVWDTNWYGPTKTLDAHVAAVRKKLGNSDWIEAVRGVGFRLESPE